MTTEATEGEVLELETDPEVQEEVEQEEQTTTETTDAGTEEEQAEDAEVEVTIGDDAPEEQETAAAPSWVKDLRKRNREQAAEIRELRQKVQQAPAEVKPVVVGEEPKLSDPDIEFDEDKFKAKWRDWNSRKAQQERQQQEKQESERKAQEAWAKTVGDYKSAKGALKVRDFDDAEGAAQEALSVVQQGIILVGAKSPMHAAQLMYVLGKSPKRLQELAAIEDPVKFAFAVAEVQGQMKVTQRKPATTPEPGVRGASPGIQGASTKLDALLKQAEKTGDMTEYFRARKAMKAQKK